ncbi:class I SAM-dependent methyltransferase [Acetobacter senegalensis]|uniref:class I SAM-dependent methyltransferase n=1 Tax=Acetobacter senegalensis TaxID=446692 RepID=UPI0007779884|nr:methyltransferase domain-containing protein [Acetobacter senegalensis]
MSACRRPHDTRIVDQFTRSAKPFADLAIHAEAESMVQTLAACAVTRDMKVLDVACGPGIIACELARVGAKVTGIALTSAMIEQARLRADRKGVKVEACAWLMRPSIFWDSPALSPHDLFCH